MNKAFPNIVRLGEEPLDYLEMLLDDCVSLYAANKEAEIVLHGLYSDAECEVNPDMDDCR